MTTLSVADRDRLAEAMATTIAPRLTYAVHRRDTGLIAGILDGLDRQELYALAVVLASRLHLSRADIHRITTARQGPPRRPVCTPLPPGQAAANRARLATALGIVDDYHPASNNA